MQAEQADGVQVPQADILTGVCSVLQIQYNEITRGDLMGRTKSYTSRSGRTVHYDEHGRKVGVSYQSPSGRVTHYDADGKRTGTSYRSSSGRLTHYDSDGRRTGTSYTSSAGVVRHYDADGHKTGTTYRSSAGVRTTYPNESRTPASSSSQADDAIGCLAIIAAFIVIIFLIT